ncbi:MAG: polysaccharide biosynthesis C-terminal domain-containing protein, partial [Chloroflexi bacterium]|nr:polysaccharide biosynthesis C-terminal domain-containing protein [Chloroflexota bacterium]
ILQLIRRANRLVMPLGWLIAGLLFAFSQPLIITWVGPEQAAAIDVLRIIALPMAIAVSAYVGISVLTGIGKIRESSLSALVIGVINPVLSIFLVVQFGMGVVGIALASALCLVARNGIYIPLLIRRHAGLPLLDYYQQLVLCAMAAVPSYIAGYLAVEYLNPIGWLKLGVTAIACSLPSLAVLLFVIAKPEDRKLLKSLLPFYEQERL